jgi:uncharacterized low-complexity protein
LSFTLVVRGGLDISEARINLCNSEEHKSPDAVSQRSKDTMEMKMNRKIVVAGAASALLLGSVAIAQTTAPSGTAAPAQSPSATTQSDTNNMSGQTGTTTGATGASSDAARSGATAAGADQYGADTAAQAGGQTGYDNSTAMAGERG